MTEANIQLNSVIPTLFIGLGGIGSMTVDRILMRASRLDNWDSHLKALHSFLAIDTSYNDLSLLRNIPNFNRIHIGAFDRAGAVRNYRDSEDQLALQWLDPNYKPREWVTDGAGQIRVESRLGYHFASRDIRHKLDQVVRGMLDSGNPWRINTPRKVFVYLFCSLGGGTGSGSFLPVSYLMQDVVRELKWEPRVISYLVLSTALKTKVDPDLHIDVHANSYAALKELEYLTKLDYKDWRLERPDGEEFVFWNNHADPKPPKVRSRPFYLSFLLDRPEHLEIKDIHATVADAAFLQLFSPIIGRLSAEEDNYEKHLQDLTLTPGKRGIGRGYAKHFGAFGAAALVLPAYELVEYSAYRFAAEAMRQQITFGAGSTLQDAKLARVQVNYDDPLFTGASTEEQYRQINEAYVKSINVLSDDEAKLDRKSGFWFLLREEVEKGILQGTDANNKEKRTESLMARVLRFLDEDRKPITAEFKLATPNLSDVTSDAPGAMLDKVNRLFSDFQRDVKVAEAGKERLRPAAEEGDALERLAPRPTPLQERFLVIRLLKSLDEEMIPAVDAEVAQKKKQSLEDSKVKDHWKTEVPAELREVAQTKKYVFMRDEESFEQKREDVTQLLNKVVQQTSGYLDADLKLTQYRSLRQYLSARARTYARLSLTVNDNIKSLERHAEMLRGGLAEEAPRLALSIEVFESLDGGRIRMWDEVYQELFTRGGRSVSTFDRNEIAEVIARQMRPVQNPDTGKFEQKKVTNLIADLQTALLDLGRDRCRRIIYGEPGRNGLTLETGLTLEAKIVLRKGEDAMVDDKDITAYVGKKLMAFSSLSGVFSRVSKVDAQTLMDGVKMARTRNMALYKSKLTEPFQERLKGLLSKEGRDPQLTDWQNPHIAICHDMDLPIPLYYFTAVADELEVAYRRVAANVNRSYNLHIDYHWEQALPNLDPRKAGEGAGWALDHLVDGIISNAIRNEARGLVWVDDDVVLGVSVSTALYRLGEFYTNLNNREGLASSVKKALETMPAEERAESMRQLSDMFKATCRRIERAAESGTAPREDLLDKNVLERMIEMLQANGASNATSIAGAPRRMSLDWGRK